jgi:trigger factor
MAQVLSRQGNKVTVRVDITANEVNQAFSKVYNSLASQVRVPGFRPGKAPRSVLEKRVGSDFVQNEVRERLFSDAYPKAVKELALVPVEATITEALLPREGTGFVFTVEVDNYPEVELPNWRAFDINVESESVGESDLDQAIEDLRQNNAQFQPVQRAIEGGDTVTVEIIEGEDAGRTYPVSMERAEPQVQAALLGKNLSDEVDVPLETPEAEDDQVETLKVRVIDVKEKLLPELNDEFAANFKLADLEALRQAVRSELTNRAAQNTHNTRRERFVTQLIDGLSGAEIPEALVKRARAAIENDMDTDLQRQSVSLKEYREYLEGEGTLSDFEENISKNAHVRVRRDLGLERLAETLKTRLTQREWSAILENYARSNRMTVAKLNEALGKEGIANLQANMVQDKALEEAIAQLLQPVVAGEVAPFTIAASIGAAPVIDVEAQTEVVAAQATDTGVVEAETQAEVIETQAEVIEAQATDAEVVETQAEVIEAQATDAEVVETQAEVVEAQATDAEVVETQAEVVEAQATDAEVIEAEAQAEASEAQADNQ